jgi:hypothetical protein
VTSRFRLLTGLIGALLIGCGSGEPPSRADTHTAPPPARVLAADFADSVEFSDETIGAFYLHRVSVRSEHSTDTLAGVVTLRRPIIVGDSVVYGLIYDGVEVVAGFAYRPGTGVERFTWPETPIFGSTPTFAPDARHVAYAANDSMGVHPVVLSWPDRAIVLRGPSVYPLETDAGLDREAWTGPDSVEIQVDLTIHDDMKFRTLRYRADVSHRTAVSDTIMKNGALQP